ncbi:DHHC palmitoyltransferase-domain-containing protein [Lipomyces arxii]|uniref:DHHC palmitoyltransferase-domain-containing protein n=1 Tax=Lipomyces arxii TaxID=56418 RepID=UPI0034CE96FA
MNAPDNGPAAAAVAGSITTQQQSDVNQNILSLTGALDIAIEEANYFTLPRPSGEANAQPGPSHFVDPTYTTPYQEGSGASEAGNIAENRMAAFKDWLASCFTMFSSRNITDDEWRLRRMRKYKLFKAVPLIMACVLGYATYVYCYVFAYKFLIVSRGGSRRAKGIGLMVVYLVLVASVFIYCALVNIQGPGYAQKIKENDGDENEIKYMNGVPVFPPIHGAIDPNHTGNEANAEKQTSVPNGSSQSDATQTVQATMPDAFLCETDGYPLWCPRCMAPKPDRAHHSSEVDRCVLKMDHYCAWVGSLIGFNNYKAFLFFVVSAVSLSIIIFTTLLAYTVIYAQERHSANAQFIVIDAISFVFALLLAPFACTHLFYVLMNTATIEFLNRKYRIYTINIAVDPDQPHIRAIVHSEFGMKLWDIGYWQNWKSVMGDNVWEWFLPWNTTKQDGSLFKYNPAILKKFRDELHRSTERSRVNDGEDSNGRFIVMRPVRN